MFSRRTSLIITGLAVLSLVSTVSIFANEDLGTIQQDCVANKDFTMPVTNGSCTGVITGHGVETITQLVNDEGEHHDESSGCQNVDYHEDSPEWVSEVCAPTYSCLENPAVDLSNASFISNHEMPYENAPDMNPPLFPLAKDFLKDIVFSDNTHVADTEDGCQYTCNDGYHVSTGACGTTGGSTATATVTGTTPPTATTLVATITNGGTGYSTTTPPTVTLTSGACTGVTATATVSSMGNVTGINFSGTGTCTSAPNITIAAPGGSGNTSATATVSGTVPPTATTLKATITNGGSGYSTTTPPAVTFTANSCPSTVTAIATVSSTGVVTGIKFSGTGTCTNPVITLAAPPTSTTTATSTSTTPSCTVAPTITIAAPPAGTISGSPIECHSWVRISHRPNCDTR